LIKLDFSNAFNTLRRDDMLEAVLKEIPEIFNFCHLSYAENSTLLFNEFKISSEEGPQQGDPLGPLLFALTIHPILQSLVSEFKTGYLDDVAIGGMLPPSLKTSKQSGTELQRWVSILT
jgi:hypothetical protein